MPMSSLALIMCILCQNFLNMWSLRKAGTQMKCPNMCKLLSQFGLNVYFMYHIMLQRSLSVGDNKSQWKRTFWIRLGVYSRKFGNLYGLLYLWLSLHHIVNEMWKKPFSSPYENVKHTHTLLSPGFSTIPWVFATVQRMWVFFLFNNVLVACKILPWMEKLFFPYGVKKLHSSQLCRIVAVCTVFLIF